MCRDAMAGGPLLVLATFDAAAADLVDIRALPLSVDPLGLEVADFTGDGLDDVAVLSGDAVTLYRQCRTDELGSDACRAFTPLP